MKVALFSPPGYPIAEPFAGGTEAFIFRLATGLLRRGIEVVCYAPKGSDIPGVEIRTHDATWVPPLPSQSPDQMSLAQQIAFRVLDDAVMQTALNDACNDPSIDIIHNHSYSAVPIYCSAEARLPVLHTLHLPPGDLDQLRAIRHCDKHGRLLHLVAVSHAQAQWWQVYHPVSRVIYPGLDAQALPPCGLTHNGTLAFAGRINPYKGIEEAIAIAVALGKRLDIYGGVQRQNVAYFQESIQPLLQKHTNIVYHGSVSQAVLMEGLRQAQALLFPIKWREPCGYVVMEAAAMGTPVIAYDRCAVRELITEGVNGFIVPDERPDAMAAAVEQAALVDRARCAADAREKFHIANSVNQYLELFNALLTERATKKETSTYGTR